MPSGKQGKEQSEATHTHTAVHCVTSAPFINHFSYDASDLLLF